MILANVGLQIYNNWCNNRQNAELQKKREEFERAARERQTERMWQIMREGQALTMELEEDNHRHRIDELKNEIGTLLQRLTYETAIKEWPLNVLPIVMKNQALGNLMANREDKIAFHCIFTPSNCNNFNDYVFQNVESELEKYCNKHWSIAGSHPILFYSGAWRGFNAPTENQIRSMKANLSNLPTVVITPYFRLADNSLVFQVNMWNMSATGNDAVEQEFEPTNFQRNYIVSDEYTEDYVKKITDDIVPYLQCLIGSLADTYFWSALGSAPILPTLLTNGFINTEGNNKYLFNDGRVYYEELFSKSEENAKEQPFMQNNLLDLYESCSVMWDGNTKNERLEDIFVCYYNTKSGNNIHSISQITNLYRCNQNDVKFIEQFKKLYSDKSFNPTIQEEEKESDILNSRDIELLKKLSNEGNAVAMFRLGEVFEYSINTEYDFGESKYYYQMALKKNYPLAICKNAIDKVVIDERQTIDFHVLNSCLESLNQLCDENICQAIIYSVALSYYKLANLYDDNELLNVLDTVENSVHPYAFYLGGEIVKEKYGKEYIPKVIELFEKSAEMGRVESYLALADLYYDGIFVQKSAQQYIFYNKTAAKLGCVNALTRIAICYVEGFGVPKSKAKAVETFKMAAELGDEDAIQILNEMA